ncbi:protein PHLOEM PROTEIN 2-LIKE A10-like [Silene latifolia]|uniref:protein PHLOEM PROTEIN 2-LIKE A10-like n=1 Tax=Silene latifolia TaxID=37657 RepID=UPI003D787B93
MMDLQLINKGLDFTKKKKKWVLILATLGLGGYGAYKVYNFPSVVRKRTRVLKLLNALVSIVEVVSESAETFGIVSRDLREFLESDSDEIPNSLKQVSKLVNSEEFSDSVVRVTAALTRGVFRGYEVESRGVGNGGSDSSSGFYDRFMDKLFSDAGSGFVSVVAGSFAKNLVTALYSGGGSEKGLSFGASEKENVDGSSWVDVMCSERGRELISGCIEKFVATAIAVYLDKTMTVNTYDELFAGLTNPKHEKPARELLVALCNGSIETLVKTSHQVLTSSKNLGSDSGETSRLVMSRCNSDIVSKTYYSEIDDACNVITIKHNGREPTLGLTEDQNASSSGQGWVSTVSSTLAVPSNRKLVLDVTGRVTFETVRSFLDFLLEKFVGSIKRSSSAVNEAVIETGRRVVRYVTAKYYVVASICLSLCLHVLGGTWMLMPA